MKPFQFLVYRLAGWGKRGQRAGIEYLLEEARALREMQGRVLRFNDCQRRRLVVMASKLGSSKRKEFVSLTKSWNPGEVAQEPIEKLWHKQF